MNDDQYQAISCAAYDIYEIAIMRQQMLELVWRDGDEEYSALVKPLDLRIRDGAEYLLVRPDPGREATQEVRLDRIVQSRIKAP